VPNSTHKPAEWVTGAALEVVIALKGIAVGDHVLVDANKRHYLSRKDHRKVYTGPAVLLELLPESAMQLRVRFYNAQMYVYWENIIGWRPKGTNGPTA
jgi:hypothetical protein